VNAVLLYAIPGAVLAAAWARAAWRCRILTRALARRDLTARLTEATLARDITALETSAHDARARASSQAAVLAQTRLIIDAAYATTRSGFDLPRGGTDG
jgi:hypothetical protein